MQQNPDQYGNNNTADYDDDDDDNDNVDDAPMPFDALCLEQAKNMASVTWSE